MFATETGARVGSPYITTWDVAIHVNVIKNLAEHCCVPQLHGEDVYLLTNSLPSYAPVGKLPIGNLYSLKHVPFEVWSQVAIDACAAPRPLHALDRM